MSFSLYLSLSLSRCLSLSLGQQNKTHHQQFPLAKHLRFSNQTFKRTSSFSIPARGEPCEAPGSGDEGRRGLKGSPLNRTDSGSTYGNLLGTLYSTFVTFCILPSHRAAGEEKNKYYLRELPGSSTYGIPPPRASPSSIHRILPPRAPRKLILSHSTSANERTTSGKSTFPTQNLRIPLVKSRFPKKNANVLSKTFFLLHVGVGRLGLKPPWSKDRPWIRRRGGLKATWRLGLKVGLRRGLGCKSIYAILISKTQSPEAPGAGQQVPHNNYKQAPCFLQLLYSWRGGLFFFWRFGWGCFML